MFTTNHFSKTSLLLITLCLLFASCGRKHKEYRSVEIDGQSIALTTLYDSLEASYSPWTDVYVPVNLSLESPTSFSISGRATMVRDQLIHMSLRMLGMEVAVLHIEGDSVHIIDKYHRKYVTGSLSRLLGNYPLNIADMQDLLLGQAFVPSKGNVAGSTLLDYKYDPSVPNQWTFEPIKKSRGVTWYSTASETMPPVLTSITFQLDNSAKVDCIYSSPLQAVAGIVNSIVNINAATQSLGVNAQIRWNMRDAKWNTGRKESLPKLSGYKEIDARALLSSLEM